MTAAGTEIERPAGVQEWAVRCDDCKAWHHPGYHSTAPFRWGRRVLARMAWLDTKRALRAWWKVLGG